MIAWLLVFAIGTSHAMMVVPGISSKDECFRLGDELRQVHNSGYGTLNCYSYTVVK